MVGHLAVLVELDHELEGLAVHFYVVRRDEGLNRGIASFQAS